MPGQALTMLKRLIIRLKAFNIITWGNVPSMKCQPAYQPEGLKHTAS